MSTETNDDMQYRSLKNFHHKNYLSECSLEALVYSRVKNASAGDDGDDLKAMKKTKEYIEELDMVTREALERIALSRSYASYDGPTNDNIARAPSDNAIYAVAEEARLTVLSKAEWYYNGSFMPDKDKAPAHPELAFSIRVRSVVGHLWYEVSYGIVKGVKSSRHGTYSLFRNLDDVLNFLRNEALTTGREQLTRYYNIEHLRSEAASKRTPLSDKDKKDILRSYSNKCKAAVDRVLSDANIEYTLYVIERSCDITTLPDLISSWLLPIADQHINKATEHLAAARRARNITDVESRGLDKPLSISATGVVTSNETGANLEPLPTPEQRREEEINRSLGGILGVNDTPVSLDDQEQEQEQEQDQDQDQEQDQESVSLDDQEQDQESVSLDDQEQDQESVSLDDQEQETVEVRSTGDHETHDIHDHDGQTVDDQIQEAEDDIDDWFDEDEQESDEDNENVDSGFSQNQDSDDAENLDDNDNQNEVMTDTEGEQESDIPEYQDNQESEEELNAVEDSHDGSHQDEEDVTDMFDGYDDDPEDIMDSLGLDDDFLSFEEDDKK